MLVRWVAVFASAAIAIAAPDITLFEDLLSALTVMQDAYFANWIGSWPEGNDWTRAVTGTYVAGALKTISQDMESVRNYTTTQLWPSYENILSRHFEELIGYYFGQDAFGIRNEAYDDMLWVVLGWLETIQYIDQQSEESGSIKEWHGRRWVPAFAHRARVFWELASRGWDQKYCGGGMIWNPRLLPYKNAITNELFIAASISMYHYFPGDDNPSPWNQAVEFDRDNRGKWPPRDPKFWNAAQTGYKWLQSSGMMNNEGLYTDGFHISGISEGSDNTKCDKRDDMLYTYNQGVILTGQLGLFKTTGDLKYLEDGHKLVRDVIKATGWDLRRQQPVDDLSKLKPGQLPPWQGLGRGGILEEACDISGECSQDGQTFKGIWMHHFTAFCEPKSLDVLSPRTIEHLGHYNARKARASHYGKCERYVPWLRHNAKAAMGTRDSHGKYGMWWTVGLINITMPNLVFDAPGILPPDLGKDDYRNRGVPMNNRTWVGIIMPNSTTEEEETRLSLFRGQGHRPQRFIYDRYDGDTRALKSRDGLSDETTRSDPNSRGRGRTGETQGGALALLRALWTLSKYGRVDT
ncbi:family 76 putative glycoside hydrolase [Podospora fimiseda]|uniref:Family 76 putative glycoside hydrolase n=1 Tax=Podospora fimiseda TaxID=252190 RepID=A0AAN7BX69_9PEZI|nr:family 76 putative glycoside hydrolase [Podospora fimiseda]